MTQAQLDKEPAMLKKTILAALAGTALLASNAALADRDHYRHKHYKVKHHYVQHRPVVHHYHHRPVVVHRPAPVYYHPAPVYYQPAPVYYQPVNPNAGLVIAGALIGGAVAWHIVNGH
jgi:hypothetical protein